MKRPSTVDAMPSWFDGLTMKEFSVRPLASDLRVDLQHVAVRIAEEDRAMPEGLVRQRRDQLDAPGLERRRAVGHRTIFFRDPDGNVLEIYAEI